LVSSGDYERFFLEGNKRYHHILDTATGYPTDTELSSVTIVSPRSVDGDGLSTLAFILGLNEGYRFIRAQEGMEAVFITKDLSVYLTPGLEGNFTPGSADFTVKPWEEAP
ncbi:MAG: FAD:protein FMN transferase, partial [Candidatus Thiodiazotropha endolucinida]